MKNDITENAAQSQTNNTTHANVTFPACLQTKIQHRTLLKVTLVTKQIKKTKPVK